MNASSTVRPFHLLVALVLLLWLALSLPLALEWETLYFRDVFSTHLPFKAFGAEALRQGEIPALNPTWALGQPFRGNPNAVALYPGNLLYLWLPFWSAFNLHYALHWLLAGVGMLFLARHLGRTREAALLAAVTYAGSGWMLAAMTFYNLLTVVAWWPLVMLGAVAKGRAGPALGGLACGLALLGGEPVTALLGMVPLLVLAWREHGPVRGTVRAGAVGAAGILVALPQLVATARLTATSFRGAHGLVASQAGHFALEPERLLELLLPHPFGLAGWEGPSGTGAAAILDHLPFYFSIHFGLVGLVVALTAVRRERALSGLAAASLALAWLGGLSGELLLAASGGYFRSPEKLLFWLALSLPLLAATGLDRLRRETVRGMGRWLLAGVGLGALLALAVVVGRGGVIAVLSGGDLDPVVLAAQSRLWALGLAATGLLLAVSWWLLDRGRAEWLVAVQIAGLLQLAPLWMTDDVAAYRQVEWAQRGSVDEALMVTALAYPPWDHESTGTELPAGAPALRARWLATRMAPAPGVLFGRSYPLGPDLEGLHHLFYGLLEIEMAQASWPERIRWLEVLGVDTLVASRRLDLPGLEPLREIITYGGHSFAHRLPGALPAVWWPERVEVAPTPRAAFERVARSPAGSRPAVLPQTIEHHPGGRVRVREAAAGRILIEVESSGGAVVVQRAYQRAWRARTTAKRELPVLPANLGLIGVLVPPGHHQVILEVAPGGEAAAALVAATAAGALLLFAAWQGRRERDRTGGPSPRSGVDSTLSKDSSSTTG